MRKIRFNDHLGKSCSVQKVIVNIPQKDGSFEKEPLVRIVAEFDTIHLNRNNLQDIMKVFHKEAREK